MTDSVKITDSGSTLIPLKKNCYTSKTILIIDFFFKSKVLLWKLLLTLKMFQCGEKFLEHYKLSWTQTKKNLSMIFLQTIKILPEVSFFDKLTEK